ncbi:MAG: phosphate ABC transporter ATP-binding protein [Alphaproteobacteria bacterium]
MSILPLQLRDVSLRADGRVLLDSLSLDIEAGPKTVILGPNGSGKSLLLRLCHGLIPPFGGTIRWRGDDAAMARRKQAMVFQDPVMLRRSVAANIAYALRLAGIDRATREARIDDMLARTGLTDLRKRPATVLSGGEQQRLALARAWALEPEVLFLDEPTASLDPGATGAVETVIEDMHRGGCKIVMTTHDLGQARRLADEVIFLHKGGVAERAPADDFFDRPASDTARAFLDGRLMW